MKKLTYILTTLTFAFACFGLWTLLNLLNSLSAQSTQALPAFTSLLVYHRGWLLVLPLPAVMYCIYALVEWRTGDSSGIGFIACTMSALCLVFFPVLLALFLPCVVLFDQAFGR